MLKRHLPKFYMEYGKDIVQSLQKYKVVTKIDIGSILLRVTDDDLVKLSPLLEKNPGLQTPNIKMSIYKNRRGRWTSMYLWCVADLGTCRIDPQFATDWHYEVLEINDTLITVNEPTAWEIKKEK